MEWIFIIFVTHTGVRERPVSVTYWTLLVVIVSISSDFNPIYFKQFLGDPFNDVIKPKNNLHFTVYSSKWTYKHCNFRIREPLYDECITRRNPVYSVTAHFRRVDWQWPKFKEKRVSSDKNWQLKRRVLDWDRGSCQIGR